MIVGGNWLIWAFDMNELSTIQTSGSANRIAAGASTRCQGLNGSRPRFGAGGAVPSAASAAPSIAGSVATLMRAAP